MKAPGHFAAWVVWLGVAAASCASPGSSTSPSAPPPAVVTASSVDHCSDPASSEETIARFARATQDGDAEAATGMFFDGQERFEWYSATSAAEHYRTYDPSELKDRFVDRFAAGEQFELTTFEWTGAQQRAGNFVFEVMWSNPDLAGGPFEARGKGAIDCASGKIIVWSVAIHPYSPGPTQTI